MFRDVDSRQERGRSMSFDNLSEQVKTPSKGHSRKPLSFHIPPPKDDGFSLDEVSPSIVEVLYYLKRVFEDETLLDDLPLEAAANPGAWHAWKAHRRKTKPSKAHTDSVDQRKAFSTGLGSPGRAKPSGDWNWDGVWVERVKRGVATSLSDQMLYGSVDGDDVVGSMYPRRSYSLTEPQIHFLDTEDESLQGLREALSLQDADIKL